MGELVEWWLFHHRSLLFYRHYERKLKQHAYTLCFVVNIHVRTHTCFQDRDITVYRSLSWKALWGKKVFFASLFPLLLFDSCSTLTYIQSKERKRISLNLSFFSPFLFYFQRNLLYHFVKWLFLSFFYFLFPFPHFCFYSSHKAFAYFIFLLLLRFISIIASSHSVRLSILQNKIYKNK